MKMFQTANCADTVAGCAPGKQSANGGGGEDATPVINGVTNDRDANANGAAPDTTGQI